MQFSTDQRHAETLAFLTEVREYLARWPPHALNLQMVKRIDAHLAEPTHRLVQRHSATHSGGSYTPAGQCLLRATLEGDTLTVQWPTGRDAAPDKLVVDGLRQGQRMRLTPDESIPS